MIFFGDNYFGLVDWVPGLFFVRTRFLHIWFFPLIPRESYLFFDEQPEGQLFGVRIPMSWKSVCVAWFRGSLVVIGVMLLGGGVIPFESQFMSTAAKLRCAGICWTLAVMVFASFWWTMRLSRTTLNRAVVLGGTLSIPRRVVEEYLRGNRVNFWQAMSDPQATVASVDGAEKESIRAALAKKEAEGLIKQIKPR